MLDLKKWHDHNLELIEQELDRLLTLDNDCSTLVDSMRYSCLDGGKRIRPLFTLAAGILSNAQVETLLTIGSAIELIHCFSLIHDDLPIMDNDDLRRGKPTNHKVYGDAVALLAGDALHAICFEILSSDKLCLPAEQKLSIIHLIANSIGVQGMVGGQTIDWLSTGQKIDLQLLQKMHSLKTGALLKASIVVGYLAGSDYQEAHYQAINDIAAKIGLLFQIIDDIIDVTEDTATLGKTANKDNHDNKATYVSILGLAEAQQTAADLHKNIVTILDGYPTGKHLKYLADLVYYRHS